MRSRNEMMTPADAGPVERPVRPAAGARRLRNAEAQAAKQAMKAGAHAALEAHYRKALEEIAYHDYGQWNPPFDPQIVAIEALKKVGVYKA